MPPVIRAIKFQQLETRDSELGSSKFQFFNSLSQLSRKFESGRSISLSEGRSRPTRPLRALLLDLQGIVFLLSPSHELAAHSKRKKKICGIGQRQTLYLAQIKFITMET